MVATRLQRLMQRLGKPWYVRRAMRVFRDDTSLSATPHLWPSIVEALKASRYLVLIASPEAAASRWVFRETEFWLQSKSSYTLLLALTAGELTWDDHANDFAWSEQTPLPPSLKGQFESEPKWIDLRASPNSTDPDLNFELSHSLDREGEALAALGKHQDALGKFKRALTIRQLLAQSAERKPDSAVLDQRRRDLAIAYERTGDEYYTLQSHDEAADMYRSSLKIRQSLSQAKPDDRDLMEDLAVGHDRIARIDQPGGVDDPIGEFKLSIAIREKLVTQNPLNSNWRENLAIDEDAVAAVLMRRGDFAGAIEQLQKALTI